MPVYFPSSPLQEDSASDGLNWPLGFRLVDNLCLSPQTYVISYSRGTWESDTLELCTDLCYFTSSKEHRPVGMHMQLDRLPDHAGSISAPPSSEVSPFKHGKECPQEPTTFLETKCSCNTAIQVASLFSGSVPLLCRSHFTIKELSPLCLNSRIFILYTSQRKKSHHPLA